MRASILDRMIHSGKVNPSMQNRIYLQLTKLQSMAKQKPTKQETVRYNVAQRNYKRRKAA